MYKGVNVMNNQFKEAYLFCLSPMVEAKCLSAPTPCTRGAISCTAVHISQGRKYQVLNFHYRKTSNIRRTLVGNKIVDHSGVVGASPVGAAPTTSSFSTSGFRLGKDSRKTVRQSFKCSDLVRLILETWRYILISNSRLTMVTVYLFSLSIQGVIKATVAIQFAQNHAIYTAADEKSQSDRYRDVCWCRNINLLYVGKYNLTQLAAIWFWI